MLKNANRQRKVYPLKMTYFALVGVYLIRGYNSRNSVYKTMRIPPGTHGPPSRSALEAFEVQIKSFRLGADDVFKSTKLCPDVGEPANGALPMLQGGIVFPPLCQSSDYKPFPLYFVV